MGSGGEEEGKEMSEQYIYEDDRFGPFNWEEHFRRPDNCWIPETQLQIIRFIERTGEELKKRYEKTTQSELSEVRQRGEL